MICLDSDFIIDYLHGKKEAIAALQKLDGNVFTTEVNVFEIFYGLYALKNWSEREQRTIIDFFSSFGADEVLPFDALCGEMSAKILTDLQKKGKVIDQNDCFIASIILKNGFNKILTGNKKHFSRVDGLTVLDY